MGRLIFLFMLWVAPLFTLGQGVPQAFNYQAVVRDATGQPLANGNVSIRLTITDGVGGPTIYRETHTVATNQYGLVNLVIGEGVPSGGIPFSAGLLLQGAASGIDNVFLVVEVDVSGGTAYVPMGSSKLQSVPYALVAGYAENAYWAPDDYETGIFYHKKVGIGTSTPTAGLHVQDSSVLFYKPGMAPTFISEATPISGPGRKMMWFSQPGAFRAGYVSGNQWNRDSTGLYSAAFGSNTVAYGDASFAGGSGSLALGSYSLAIGRNDTASGGSSIALGSGNLAFTTNSVAIGYENKARQVFSTAIGHKNVASGDYSTAFGNSSTSIGYHSVALGYNTIARSFAEVAIGAFNTNLSGGITGWNSYDRIFVVGNGISDASRSDAFQVFKSGDVVIGSNGTKITNIQEGSIGAGTQTGNNKKSVPITFPNAFTNTANVRVLLTPKLASGVSDAFILSVRNITATGCIVEIYRADAPAGNGWGSSFDVQWIAWE